MYKPSDLVRARAVAEGALLASTLALAGVSPLEAGTSAAPAPKAEQRATGPWQIRCWQDGRLLFEENGVSLPDSAQYPTLIAGADRQGWPVYVAETRNATCLMRQTAADRGAWPR
ncbi:MAG: hypothetical protein ABI433_10775 [Burkholderiaceae bacterium]